MKKAWMFFVTGVVLFVDLIFGTLGFLYRTAVDSFNCGQDVAISWEDTLYDFLGSEENKGE